MEYLGYFASILIGISLGLIGSGGSILTVPVLVYLLSVDVVAATAYSLFIVGFTAALGSIDYFRKGLIETRTAIVFGIPSIIAVFLTRAYLVPWLPESMIHFGNLEVTKSMFLLCLFAILMMISSVSMIKDKNGEGDNETGPQEFNYPLILGEGLLVGTITGLVGAGGGFLIIPALVLLSKLPIKKAIGTSLVIIAAKSLIGFLGESEATVIDWLLIIKVTIFAAIGLVIGIYLSKKIDGKKLKPIFGWFVLLMGIYIILKETIF